jgi:hypothetical protein
MAGFVVFFLAGFVFGYAAPGLSAFLPVLLPLVIGIYTGVTQGFDGHVITFTIIGIVVTFVAVLLGRALAYRLEGGEARSSSP